MNVKKEGTAAYPIDEKKFSSSYEQLQNFGAGMLDTLSGCFGDPMKPGTIPIGKFIRNVARCQIARGRGGAQMDAHLQNTIKALQDILDGKLNLNSTD